MTTVNVVARKDLGRRGASRFDAEAFDEDVLRIERDLLAFGGASLGALIAESNVPTITPATISDSHSFAYCSISSVDGRDGTLFPEILPAALLPSRAKWLVQPGDILISQVRPGRGAVSRVPANLTNAIASSGFYAVPFAAFDDGTADALYFFLRSSLARRQLVRRNRNSMFPAVAPQDVASIVVPPIPHEVRIQAAKRQRSLKELEETWWARRAELQAFVNELVEAIGAPPSPLESRRSLDTTTIRRPRAFGKDSGLRVDAEFFRQEYDDFDSKISASGAVPLGTVFDVITGAKVNGDDLVPIFKQSALTNSGLNLSAVGLEPAAAGRGVTVRPGDVLIASTAHEIAYVGKRVDLVRDLPDEFLSNQAVAELMILRPKASADSSVSASFVVDFLRHEAGRHQFQRCIRGLRGGHTYPRDVAMYVKIPKPSSEWMATYEATARACDDARAQVIDQTAKAVKELEIAIGDAVLT